MKPSANVRRQLQKAKRENEATEIEEVEARLKAQAPASGTNPLAEDLNTGSEKTIENYWPMSTKFSQLPISARMKRGLENGKFETMTEVQRATLPHALVGRDVLGAAKTGSGKTLSFLIPILEKLWRLKWSIEDGLGALIISPTRELALQTFTVLRTIGAPHNFSAGLLIGGTNYKAEQQRIYRMNVLVATPGRLLQHLSESPNFSTDNLQILVLDEADQILNEGFEKDLKQIISYLPSDRQTMLFSATQTSSVGDLARLSLNRPEFLSVHAEATNATPDRLAQNYIIMDEGEKLNILWSFIKAHLRKKILVFFQSQRQVKFVFEAFRHMRPGLPVMHLHGGMGQTTRREVFDKFDKAKFAVMLSTDVSARGLDFEGVHWVIQFDCPDKVASYIHRVGRTARNGLPGRSTLFLLPSESPFREELTKARIPISKTNINSARALEIDNALQALMIQKPDLKVMAQKAIKNYLKAIYLMSNKQVFDVTKINIEALSKSYGLLQPPRIRFMDVKKIDKNLERMKSKIKMVEQKIKEIDEKAAAAGVTGAEGDDALLAIFKKEKKKLLENGGQGKTKIERLMASKNRDVLTKEYDQFRPEEGMGVFDFEESDGDDEEEGSKKKKSSKTKSIDSDSDGDEGEILRPKKKSKEEIERELREAEAFVAPTKDKKERFKISVHKETGKSEIFSYSDDEEGGNEELEDDESIPFAKRVAKMIESTDEADREAQIEKIRERRRKKVAEEKAERRRLEALRAAEGGAVLGNPVNGSDDEQGSDASGSQFDGSDVSDDGNHFDDFSGSDEGESAQGGVFDDEDSEEERKSKKKNSKKRKREDQSELKKRSKKSAPESDSEDSSASDEGIPRVLARTVWKKKQKKSV